MKRRFGFLSILLLFLVIGIVSATDSSTTSSTSTSSSTSSTSDEIDDSALVYVSNVTMEPEVFFPYEVGTITVTLTNSGDSAIGLSGPDILSNKVHIKEQVDWNTLTYIGAGSTVTYSFVVTVDPPEGNYYALFTVGTKSGSAIHYPLQIKVNSDPLTAVIADKPDSFALDGTDNVTLRLINTRGGAVKNIVVTAKGDGVEVSPQQAYLSTVAADNSSDITFAITTHEESNVTFDVSYQNGDNDHTTSVVLPIELGSDKTIAVPVLNNVVLSTSGSYYDITGDITNAGISDAKGVVVTVDSPAVASGTYPEYAIGSIAADDSGSFEVTFTSTDISAVPVVITWKDSTGNNYKVTKTVDLSSSSGSTGSSTSSSSGTSFSGSGGMSGGPDGMGGGPGGSSSSTSSTSLFTSKGSGLSSFTLPIAAGIIAIVCIVLYTKRKWILSKVRKQQ
ncbi:MAG: hypothetical protein WC391_04555 [Methanoregula sp.]